MKKQLKAYIKNIKKDLPCFNSAMRKMLNSLKQDIETYIEENNVSDFNEIENHFGTAKTIAQEFSIGIDSTYIKVYKRKRTITTIIVSTVMASFAIFIILLGYIIIDTILNLPVSEEIVTTVF